MARSTPADGTAQQRSDRVRHDSLLAAKRGAVAHGLSLLAELGRGGWGRQLVPRSARTLPDRSWACTCGLAPDKTGHEFAMVFGA